MATSLSTLSDEQLQVYKDLLSKKQGTTPQTSKTSESTLGKVGDFLKGQVYDPTLGSIGQGARDVMTPGSRLKGAHEIYTGAEKAATPLAVAGAIAAPEVAIPAMALGTLGQVAGKYGSEAFGAGEDLSNVIGDASGLGAGIYGGYKGPNFTGAAKGAYTGFRDTPMGSHPFLKGWAGETIGGAINPELRAPGYVAGMLSNKLGGAAKGAIEGFKGPVLGPKAPSVPTKGLNLAQLQNAVKSGTMTHEQFENELPRLGYNPEAAKTISSNLRTELAPKSNIKFPVTSPKTLSLGQLQRAVSSGRMTMEDFTQNLKESGYNDKHADELTEQLKDSLKEDEEDEGDKPEKKKPKSSGIGEVKSPLGEVKSPLESQIVEPNLTPPAGHESFLETEPPYKSPITEQQIEESQSDARVAKETTLARHLVKNKVDLNNIPRTAEYLKAVGNEAGLKRVPSLRTLENAIDRAKELNKETSKKPLGSERGSFSLKNLKVENPRVNPNKLNKLFESSDIREDKLPIGNRDPFSIDYELKDSDPGASEAHKEAEDAFLDVLKEGGKVTEAEKVRKNVLYNSEWGKKKTLHN